MMLHELRPAKNSTKRKRRIGRGIGSGQGKTATRGNKGQKARRQVPAWLEGGQTPIHRRLPVKKGFRNVNHKEFAVVNLATIDKHFAAGSEVTPESLAEKGIISDLKDGVKILAFGELTKKLTVKANFYSKAAAEKISKAGGEAVTL